MPDTRKNFTSMTTEEILSELDYVERIHLAIKRTESQLRLFRQCPDFILWDKDRRELSGEEAIEYLEKRLMALTKELTG